MSSRDIIGIAIVVSITVLFICFLGEPDLIDGILEYLMRGK